MRAKPVAFERVPIQKEPIDELSDWGEGRDVEIYDGLLAFLGQGRLPWLDTIDAIKDALTGDIAKAIGSIAVLIGGLMIAFGEGGSKRTVAGILLGLGIALTAVSFVDWMASL